MNNSIIMWTIVRNIHISLNRDPFIRKFFCESASLINNKPDLLLILMLYRSHMNMIRLHS